MIVCLTPNPALDVTYTFPALTIGASHRVPAPQVRAGGKGVNVARVAHAQGYDVRALVTLGGSSGAAFETELVDSRIPHRAVAISGSTRQSIALVAGGQATLLNEFGDPLSHADAADVVGTFGEECTQGKVATISGSLPPEAPEDFLPSLIAAAGALPTIVDTSGPALLTAARAGANVLKPNDEELREATGEQDPLEGARVLLGLGACLVIASLGEAGLLAVSGGGVVRARLPYALEGNPTGAGDAVVAALATSIHDDGGVERLDLPRALARAVSWSAAAVLMPQAGEISDDHRRLLDDVIVTEG